MAVARGSHPQTTLFQRQLFLATKEAVARYEPAVASRSLHGVATQLDQGTAESSGKAVACCWKILIPSSE